MSITCQIDNYSRLYTVFITKIIGYDVGQKNYAWYVNYENVSLLSIIFLGKKSQYYYYPEILEHMVDVLLQNK